MRIQTSWKLTGLGRLCLTAACLMAAIVGCNQDDPEVAQPILLNFHTVADGQVYRSPQLSGEALAWVIDRYGIKTVVNLRGPNPGEPWYDQETETCRAKNVAQVDLRMSSQSLPSPDLLRSIVETLRTSAYPLLIHCQSGADRTGAVCALYRMDVLGHERAAAMAELAPQYWHFRAQKPCMDTIAEIYEPTAEWMDAYEQDFEQIICK